MSALKIDHLSKKFKANQYYSLEDANLEVNDRDIVGLIGKNGAGKSTLLKLIAKSYIPTSGTVVYHGKDIYKNDGVLKDVGIMIEPVFYPYMTVEENLKFYLAVHGKQEYEKNIDRILDLVDLAGKKHSKPEAFSFGMKQRLSLAIVLVDEPDFLILDEPFVGLDPYGVQDLLEILKSWVRERNIAMIISSHQLGELECICNRFVMMESGRMRDVQIEEKRSLGRYFMERG